ncbi:unnamed protein product, partial [Didymodactylos carnosus]
YYSQNILIEHDDAILLNENEIITLINWGNFKIVKINKKDISTIESIEAETQPDNKDYKKTVKLTWLLFIKRFLPANYALSIAVKVLLNLKAQYKMLTGIQLVGAGAAPPKKAKKKTSTQQSDKKSESGDQNSKNPEFFNGVLLLNRINFDAKKDQEKNDLDLPFCANYERKSEQTKMLNFLNLLALLLNRKGEATYKPKYEQPLKYLEQLKERQTDVVNYISSNNISIMNLSKIAVERRVMQRNNLSQQKCIEKIFETLEEFISLIKNKNNLSESTLVDRIEKQCTVLYYYELLLKFIRDDSPDQYRIIYRLLNKLSHHNRSIFKILECSLILAFNTKFKSVQYQIIPPHCRVVKNLTPLKTTNI